MRILRNRMMRKDKRLGSAAPRQHYDIPLDNSTGTNFLVLLIALMTFLAVMALAAGLGMNAISEKWSSGLENKMTIEIPAENEKGDLRTEEQILSLSKKVEDALNKEPEIKNIEPLTQEEIENLLSPWLGETQAVKDIPLPGLISLELHVSRPEIIENIQKTLSDIDPSIRLDTHEEWLGDILRLARALQLAAMLSVLIITGTTIVAVMGGVRTRMALYSEDVELLHLMGASDRYIMRQFARHALLIALKGSLAGLTAAVTTIWLLSLFMGHSYDMVLPQIEFGTMQFLTLLALPVLACTIAVLAARYTVLRVLSLIP